MKTSSRNRRRQRNHPSIEVLEARIAPAVFFVEANGTIVNSSGASANDSAAAALAAGADTHLTMAVDLHAGARWYSIRTTPISSARAIPSWSA